MKHQAKVTGLDIYSWMEEYSKRHTPKEVKDQLMFITYQPGGVIPLDECSMDIVFSKGVLTNIPDKPQLFDEIYRVLQPNGSIVLIDWLIPEESSSHKQTLKTGEASYKETRGSYKKMLQAGGFVDIEFDDRTDEYFAYAEELGKRLKSEDHKNQYRDAIDVELRKLLISGNDELVQSIKNGEQLSYQMRARKGVALAS